MMRRGRFRLLCFVLSAERTFTSVSCNRVFVFFVFKGERVQHLLSGDANQAAIHTYLITPTHKHGCTLRICKLGVVIQDERRVFVPLFSH